MTQTAVSLRISPWNLAVGAWLGAIRRRRRLSSEQMADCFGEAIRPAYLRTLEAGQNALPATAVRGLVEGYGLSFANASMLVASVRILDVREAKGRAYDADRLAKAASLVASLWPNAQGMMDWLIEQLQFSTDADGDLVSVIRNNAKDAVPRFEQMLAAAASNGHAMPGDLPPARLDVNPFFEDALDALVKRLSLMPPELTEQQVRQWERETAPRWTAVWGVVSDPEAVIRLFADYDWSFLLNQGRPPLRIFVKANRQTARTIETAFIDKAAARLLRSNAEVGALNVEVHSWNDQSDRIQELLTFDHATRRVAPARPTGQDTPASFTAFKNAWLYEVSQTSDDNPVPEKRRLGFLDSFTLREPRFYCATLGREDLRLWFEALEALHD